MNNKNFIQIPYRLKVENKKEGMRERKKQERKFFLIDIKVKKRYNKDNIKY